MQLKPNASPFPFLQFLARQVIRFRMPLSLIIFSFLFVLYLRDRLEPRLFLSLKDPMGLIGLLLIFGGVLLRSWSAGVIRKSNVLATTGPYALMRHPLYAGSFLLALGFSIVLWDPRILIAIFLVALFLYTPKIRQEESFLQAKFPDQWNDYCLKTARFFPRHKPALQAPWSLSQWKYNKEYKTALTSLVGLIVLELIRRFV